VLCVIDRKHNTFIGRQEGWVALLFTHPTNQFQALGLKSKDVRKLPVLVLPDGTGANILKHLL
jgi:hypothetical protein